MLNFDRAGMCHREFFWPCHPHYQPLNFAEMDSWSPDNQFNETLRKHFEDKFCNLFPSSTVVWQKGFVWAKWFVQLTWNAAEMGEGEKVLCWMNRANKTIGEEAALLLAQIICDSKTFWGEKISLWILFLCSLAVPVDEYMTRCMVI